MKLIIGAPVSSVAGIGNGAKNGVLIKGSEVMDQFSKVDTIVFDKTGTLTKGKPEVTDIKVFDSNKKMICSDWWPSLKRHQNTISGKPL